MEKIRILHCLVRVGSGGVEKRRFSIISNLDREKYTQSVVCTDIVGELAKEMKASDCEVHCIGELSSVFDLVKYIRLIKIIRKYRPHIIHGGVYEGNLLASICGKICNVPVIFNEETSDPKNRSWKGHQLARVFFGLSDRVIGVSDHVCRYLHRELKLKVGKVSLINNGVRDNFNRSTYQCDRDEIRQELNIPAEKIVIGVVCRLEDDMKRVSTTIKAVSTVLQKGSNVHLLIVGDGEDKDSLMELADDYNVANNITFVGYQLNTAPYYAVMDIFTLASRREAFGLVLAEAMFFELPIVATKVGGIPSVVNNNETGILFEVDNIEQYSYCLTRLIDSKELRKKLGENGRKRASKYFSEQRYINDVTRLYTQSLEDKK